MSDTDDDRTSLLTALTTEHFALQSAASATISESSARATIYLSALSSSLVAVGFASSDRAVLNVFATTLLPVLFVLGVFTAVRLVTTSVENVAALRSIDAIRSYYAQLTTDAARFFPPSSLETSGRRPFRRSGVLFTIGTMIVFVNGALGGSTVALIVLLNTAAPTWAGILAGVLVAVLALAVGLGYQIRSIRSALSPRAEE